MENTGTNPLVNLVAATYTLEMQSTDIEEIKAARWEQSHHPFNNSIIAAEHCREIGRIVFMTPAELTKLLYQENALQGGRVLEVHITENETFNSQIQHLKVSYSPDATPQMPLEDYRLMIIIFLQVAIWDQTNGSVRDYWWPKLQRLMSAARDLDCLSLLR